MVEVGRRVAGAKYALIRLALWLFACATAFALAEVALRIYTPFTLVVTGNRIVLPTNRQYIFKKRDLKLSPWTADKLDPIVTETRNSLGFRGAEPPAALGEYLTIIAIGGSTTQCRYLTDGKTWPDRLAEELSATFSPFWLNNAGLDGHSTVGHTILMEDYIVRLKPKLVLFLIGINDLSVEQALPFDRPMQRLGLDFSTPKKLFASAANYSQVLAIVLNLYRDSRAQRLDIGHIIADFTTLSTRVVSENDRTKALARASHGLSAFEQRLARLIAISRQSGIEPVLMTQPVLYGRGVDDVTGVNLELLPVSDLNGEVAWEVLEMYNHVTRNVGRREGVLVIDLAAKLAKSSRYYYDFYHYTNEGATRIAKIVNESLCPFLVQRYPEHVRGKCAAERVPHDASGGGGKDRIVRAAGESRRRS